MGACRELGSAGQGGEEEVLECWGFGGRGCDGEGLGCFCGAGFGGRRAGEEVLPEVCYAEDGGGALCTYS